MSFVDPPKLWPSLQQIYNIKPRKMSAITFQIGTKEICSQYSFIRIRALKLGAIEHALLTIKPLVCVVFLVTWYIKRGSTILKPLIPSKQNTV